jgi:hypothetical protein
MTFSVRRFPLAMTGIALLAACRAAAPIVPAIVPPPQLPAPSVTSQWVATQSMVLALIAENRLTAADSSLRQFARSNAPTPEGDRARWWRTLMRVDARTLNGDATVALAQIDSLLTDSLAIEVRAEAVLMRRSLNTVDSVRKAEVRRRTQAAQLATDRLDELKIARDSMAKLGAEIERLKRRLRP